jgi:hypothetical protein
MSQAFNVARSASRSTLHCACARLPSFPPLVSSPRVRHRTTACKSVLSRRDRPTAEARSRRAPPLAPTARSVSPLLALLRTSFLSFSFSLSYFLLLSRFRSFHSLSATDYSSLSLSLSLSPSPSLSLSLSLCLSFFPALFLFLRSPFASPFQVPLSFSFILFLYFLSSLIPPRHFQSQLRVTEKVLQFLILSVLLAYDDGKTKGSLPPNRVHGFPARAISEPCDSSVVA